MKNSYLVLPLTVVALSVASSHASAQVPSCIDQAKSNTEIDQCGGQLIPHIEATIDAEFKRLAEKFKGNDKMQEMLKTTKQNWNTYRKYQCTFEAMAASGGQTLKPFSLEANKAYFKCVVRNLDEMKSSLNKF